MLTIYTLSNCDTCREATKWLRAHGIAFSEKAIRETPPLLPELKAMLAGYGGERRKLFNVSGREYRAEKLAEKLLQLDDAAALALLAGNGSLVKRPFLIGSTARKREVALVGFDEAAWSAALLSK